MHFLLTEITEYTEVNAGNSSYFESSKFSMKINIHSDYQALSRATADLIVSYIVGKPNSLICLASGHTPLGVFECLVKDVKDKKVDISQCVFVGLDEWVGIGPKQDGSCRLLMDEFFFDPLNIPAKQIHFFDALSGDLQHEADKINSVIGWNGGLDIMLVGIGTNGHIAMNEPGTPFDSIAHISELAEETKVVGQKYFKSSTELKYGITLGLKHFAESKLPILMANGSKKSAIMKNVLEGRPDEHVPASIVHHVPHSIVMLDQEAAAELKS
jgi:glucosamine-6-phosphate isomerase